MGQEGMTTNTQKVLGEAKFGVGQIVRHRLHSFRGVIFDVDPIFANSEEWYDAIPADQRPPREQPFYHLLAQNPEDGPYEAYVSEQNLLPDAENGPIQHPMIDSIFEGLDGGRYLLHPTRWQ